jgi:hypothetical protein
MYIPRSKWYIYVKIQAEEFLKSLEVCIYMYICIYMYMYIYMYIYVYIYNVCIYIDINNVYITCVFIYMQAQEFLKSLELVIQELTALL